MVIEGDGLSIEGGADGSETLDRAVHVGVDTERVERNRDARAVSGDD
jgi:hypothetical protein